LNFSFREKKAGKLPGKVGILEENKDKVKLLMKAMGFKKDGKYLFK